MSENNILDIDITQNPADEEVIEIFNEETTPSDDESKVEGEETTPSDTPKAKNKSNFKKILKASKAKDKRIADLEAKIADNKGNEEEEENEDNDSDEPLYDRVDLLEFITDTPWAWELKNQIKETLDEFPWISFEKALAYAKSQWPMESKSHTMFNTKSVKVSKKKKLTELTIEEAWNANLNSEQYDIWSKAQEKTVNPFG